MTEQSRDKIEALLKEEVAARSLSSCIAYFLTAVVIYIYHFSSKQMTTPIRSAAVLMFFSAILRLLASRSYVRRPEFAAWRGIQIASWINSLSWAVIFAVTSFELHNSGKHFAVLLACMMGVLSGSLVTLANSPAMYLPFLVSCIAPLSAVALMQWLSWDQQAGYQLLIVYTLFAIYQGLQFKKVRAIQIDRLLKQVELEMSLEELKASQEAFVKQTAKLFHASKLSALGEMAGGLSHEVNNSLMTIMGSIQQLDRYFQRDQIKSEDYKKKIVTSREAIHQIKTVIDGLRFFSQQADEGEKIDRPLEEIIQRTLNFCNEMIKANEITMIVAPIPPVMVHCNPMQITQILFYLTKNAFDALEGVDDPMKRWIRISFSENENDIEIRVMNGGPQISADVRTRLFQPFFTTKEVGKGTGLSLSISRGIALAHKGEIYHDENADCTTFALKIPSAPLAGAAHA